MITEFLSCGNGLTRGIVVCQGHIHDIGIIMVTRNMLFFQLKEFNPKTSKIYMNNWL